MQFYLHDTFTENAAAAGRGLTTILLGMWAALCCPDTSDRIGIPVKAAILSADAKKRMRPTGSVVLDTEERDKQKVSRADMRSFPGGGSCNARCRSLPSAAQEGLFLLHILFQDYPSTVRSPALTCCVIGLLGRPWAGVSSHVSNKDQVGRHA